MSLSIVLLSSDGYYLGPDGELPKRPDFDKSLITALAMDAVVLCSENTKRSLPKSITSIARRVTTDPEDDWTVNFGIATFNNPSSLFILVSGYEPLNGGKKFDMQRLYKSYTRLTTGVISLWSKKQVSSKSH